MVRNAPSRWIESSLFQSENGKSTIGLTILNAGVADQNVDAAEFLHCVGDASLDRGFVDDVHRDCERVRSLGFDLARGGFGGAEIEIGDHRDAALRGEAERDVLADAAGGAGDKRDLSVKIDIAELPFKSAAR